jgi:hypothetical protein
LRLVSLIEAAPVIDPLDLDEFDRWSRQRAASVVR